MIMGGLFSMVRYFRIYLNLLLAGFILSAAFLVGGCQGTDSRAEIPVSLQSAEKQVVAQEIIPASAADINNHIKNLKAKVILLNNWATWCVPCVEEFPDLVRLHNNYKSKGLEIVFVTMDFEENLDDVSTFLEEQKVDFPTFIKTGKDEDYINGIHSEWDGAIPATFIYGAGGELHYFIENKETYEGFEKQVVSLLDNS
jgi:thiol-disulfide isomerase/thioredoxin